MAADRCRINLFGEEPPLAFNHSPATGNLINVYNTGTTSSYTGDWHILEVSSDLNTVLSNVIMTLAGHEVNPTGRQFVIGKVIYLQGESGGVYHGWDLSGNYVDTITFPGTVVSSYRAYDMIDAVLWVHQDAGIYSIGRLDKAAKTFTVIPLADQPITSPGTFNNFYYVDKFNLFALWVDDSNWGGAYESTLREIDGSGATLSEWNNTHAGVVGGAIGTSPRDGAGITNRTYSTDQRSAELTTQVGPPIYLGSSSLWGLTGNTCQDYDAIALGDNLYWLAQNGSGFAESIGLVEFVAGTPTLINAVDIPSLGSGTPYRQGLARIF